jgi:hypothetical protein
MTSTLNLSMTDYMAIARLVADSAGDEPSTYEVEYKADGYTLYLDIAHEFDTRTERGGSYGGYQFERLTAVINEEYDVIGYTCLDDDGERVACDFSINTLTNILN